MVFVIKSGEGTEGRQYLLLTTPSVPCALFILWLVLSPVFVAFLGFVTWVCQNLCFVTEFCHFFRVCQNLGFVIVFYRLVGFVKPMVVFFTYMWVLSRVLSSKVVRAQMVGNIYNYLDSGVCQKLGFVTVFYQHVRFVKFMKEFVTYGGVVLQVFSSKEWGNW